jgi:hypothetical protein
MFAGVYFGGSMGVAAGADIVGLPAWLANLACHLVVAPFAVATALRFGRLGWLALFGASLALVGIFNGLTAVTYIRLAPGGTLEWARMFTLQHLFNVAVILLAPQVWLAILRRAFPGLASNNSSKPTPLRGAA